MSTNRLVFQMKINIHVTGTTFYKENYDSFLNSEENVENLFLVPDPENKFDKNAVKVLWGEKQIGWVAKKEAEYIVKTARKNKSGWRVCQKNVFSKQGNSGLWLIIEDYKIV